jgi:hypothetical protein
MKGLFSYAWVLLTLFFFQLAQAQDRWDLALDRYERICEECLRLRNLAARGQTVPANDLSTLLGELSTLRQQLRQAEGSMSGRQQTRFQNIRQQYASLFFGGRRELASIPAGPEIPNPFQLKKWPIPPLRYKHRPVTSTLPERPLQFTLAAFCGLPDVNLGLMAGMQKGSWGAYLKASTTLSHRTATGQCLSTGTSPSGGYVWTSGKSSLSRLSVSGGVLWQVFPFASVYAGAGYGIYRRLWEDAAGQWLEVLDLSARGLAAEAGIQVPLGHFLLMAGASTIGFRNIHAEVGIGWTF